MNDREKQNAGREALAYGCYIFATYAPPIMSIHGGRSWFVAYGFLLITIGIVGRRRFMEDGRLVLLLVSLILYGGVVANKKWHIISIENVEYVVVGFGVLVLVKTILSFRTRKN